MNMKLKKIIYNNEDTQGKLADYLNISPCRLGHKVAEKDGAEFKQGEIKKIIQRYKLTAEEVMDIFFS